MKKTKTNQFKRFVDKDCKYDSYSVARYTGQNLDAGIGIPPRSLNDKLTPTVKDVHPNSEKEQVMKIREMYKN